MTHTLESTPADAVPLEGWPAVEAALDAAARPPHPWVTIADEWGNLLRAEGMGGAFRLEARAVDAHGVRWYALGREESPGTQAPMHLPGRTVKVAPTERLTLDDVKAAFKTVIEQGKLPEDMPKRPLSGDHGRMYLMVTHGDEPRPALGWTDIRAQLEAQPKDDALVAALSEPGRVLIGVFGNGDQITITVRESRDERNWERRLGHLEGSSQIVELQLPQGVLEVPKKNVLRREDALIALESLYRFDAPPPGFTWQVVP